MAAFLLNRSSRLRSFRAGISLRQGLFAAGAAVCSMVSFPPVGLWPLALAAIALFLWVLRDLDTETARNLGLLYGLAYGLGALYRLFGIFGLLALPLVAIFAAYFGLLAHLVAMTLGYPPLCRALLVGMFAAGIEWLRGDAWYLRFPWYTVPHALAQEPHWIALTRWLGAYGLSFVIWALAALGAFAHYRWWAAFALLPAGSLLLPNLQPATHRAWLFQGEDTDQLERLISRLPTETVEVVILPEYAYHSSPALALKARNGPGYLARKCACPVVFGAVDGDLGATFRNVAVVIDAHATVQGSFTKQHPVPLFADGVAGTERPVFPVDSGVLGVAICFDFDAPDVAASLARQGATVLAAPTFDAMSWGRMQHVHHELLLRLRAVENDRWILRAASSGRTETVNPHGQPSEEGVEIGDTGVVLVHFASADRLAWGSRTAFLGPAAAVGCALFAGVWAFRRLRKGRATTFVTAVGEGALGSS
jgi:apolipoprotein N-acyltransferase